MKDKKSDQKGPNALTALLDKSNRVIQTYRAFIFFLLVAVFYGFIIWRVNVYSNAPASQSEKSAQSASQPHIDQATLEKIQNLQDNSVSVQTIFNEARNNPFQ